MKQSRTEAGGTPAPQGSSSRLALAVGLCLAMGSPGLHAADPGPAPAPLNRLAEGIQAHPEAAVLGFTESRDRPVRRGAPLMSPLSARPVFQGVARPGEFYVFQIGLYPLQETGPLGFTCSDLVREGDHIPGTAVRCLSLGGTNYLGQPFAKTLQLQPGRLQVLWMSVAVPPTAGGLPRHRAGGGVAGSRTSGGDHSGSPRPAGG
ncbi:MAG: DUF6067 family protein [Verrucomicrobia bacterium]|nr:DUF6067 family protein [Verrucomicrobiota bacterium]